MRSQKENEGKGGQGKYIDSVKLRFKFVIGERLHWQAFLPRRRSLATSSGVVLIELDCQCEIRLVRRNRLKVLTGTPSRVYVDDKMTNISSMKRSAVDLILSKVLGDVERWNPSRIFERANVSLEAKMAT